MYIVAIYMCFVNYLSGEVGEDYEGVIFGNVWDIEDGCCEGELVWTGGV